MREDCRFHCLFPRWLQLIWKVIQPRNFSEYLPRSDQRMTFTPSKRTPFLTTLFPTSKLFSKARPISFKFTCNLGTCSYRNGRYASMKCAISLMLEKSHGYRKYAKILVDMHENCTPFLTCFHPILMPSKSSGPFLAVWNLLGCTLVDK
jgi:hypothetical protein